MKLILFSLLVVSTSALVWTDNRDVEDSLQIKPLEYADYFYDRRPKGLSSSGNQDKSSLSFGNNGRGVLGGRQEGVLPFFVDYEALPLDNANVSQVLNLALHYNPILTEISVLKAGYLSNQLKKEKRLVLKAALGVCQRESRLRLRAGPVYFYDKPCSLQDINKIAIFEIEAVVEYIGASFTINPSLRKVEQIGNDLLGLKLKQEADLPPFLRPGASEGLIIG